MAIGVHHQLASEDVSHDQADCLHVDTGDLVRDDFRQGPFVRRRWAGGGVPDVEAPIRRVNYKKAGTELEIDLISNPEQAASVPTGCLIAAWYWADRRLNQLADEDSEDAYRRITRRINGGYNGWQDRRTYYQRARLALGMAPI